jgi:hypothetical protein
MNLLPRRLRGAALVFALITLPPSALAAPWGVGIPPPDPNLPVYDRAAPLSTLETARPAMDPDYRASSYAFSGADYTEDPTMAHVYLQGREPSRDGVSPNRNLVGDGRPDTWLRVSAPNLGFYMRRGGGFYIKELILHTKGYPYRRWDTVANSSYPLLQVVSAGRTLNSATGSIAGFNPPRNGIIELYIADDGLIATRHTPLELVIISLDGELRVDVGLHNIYDSQVD